MCSTEKRDPLAKEVFLGGIRQKWIATLLGFMVLILVIDRKCDLDPRPYLDFLTWIGVASLGGMSMSAWNKEQAAKEAQNGPKV